MNDLLFVYGTLHPDRAPAEIAHAVRQMELLGEGSIRARKYQFAQYPAIQLDESTTTRGHLFRVPQELWSTLDEYERYEPARPRLSLFVRRRVLVERDGDEPVEAWVYEYARPLPREARG